jgi:tRNA modification GTPase
VKSVSLAATDTIAALSSAPGMSAVALVRVSGPEAISLVTRCFQGKVLTEVPSHKAVFGRLMQGEKVLDEVLVTVFRAPHSFTGEDVVEIGCHGSVYIIEQVLTLLVQLGARLAEPGEFTMRGFRNQKFDLLKAEAIADLIHAESSLAHAAAMNMLKGGLSSDLKTIRTALIDFASLIELELDFSEEDVEFASRESLLSQVEQTLTFLEPILDTYQYGNAIKRGIPVVIAGKPNAGKSTLLNRLLQEEKAIVSSIPGTTRDVIEDTIHIEGIQFRFIDTAGLRVAGDLVEQIGISRARERIKTAQLVLYLFDASAFSESYWQHELVEIESLDNKILLVGNKIDKASDDQLKAIAVQAGSLPFVLISAEKNIGLEALQKALLKHSGIEKVNPNNIILTNLRHYESLKKVVQQLEKVKHSLQSHISTDLLAEDLRSCIFHFGEVTGEITNDDILGNIFSKFCIGK